MEVTTNKLIEIFNQIQANRPIIHCITNVVTVNDCANILLALGASPTMAHHPLEVEEITAGTNSLVCNLGAITDYEAMEKAGKVAHALGHAIVIDPVGISGSTYRREKCQKLIEKIHPTCIRGNYSEIRALMMNQSVVVGVDSKDEELDIEAMKKYSLEHHVILVASGKTDIITDGIDTYLCNNGDRIMSKITGSGCMSSVMLGVFLGIEPSVYSAASCCGFMGIIGELAKEKTDMINGGTMTFRNLFIDEVSLMSSEKLRHCNLKIVNI